jgi:hypothetical protein
MNLHQLFARSVRLFVLFMLLATSNPANAELPLIRFDRLSPIGAAAGSTIEVEILGGDIEEAKSLLFDHPGLKAEFVKERFFKVSVAADVPAGTYDVRLVGRFGVSNPRLLAISHGLTDVAEVEPNNEPEKAQIVAMNSAINGSSDQNGEDWFRFEAKRGQRVTVDCLATRLDSTVDGTLTLTNKAGKQLASNSDYFGADPFLDFVAPEDGEFFVKFHDLTFNGGAPYRLVISDRPHVENVFPRAITAGQSATLTVLGRNLGSGAKKSAAQIHEAPLEEIALPVSAPLDVLDLQSYRFLEHPTDHSVLPTAGTCTLTGFQWRPELPGVGLALNAQRILVTKEPVTIEAEPNNSFESPQPITLPAIVAGRFDQPRDTDWFEVTVPENGQYAVEVFCERISGRADPVVVAFDEKKNRVGEFDDFGHRQNAFDGHLRDPVGMFSFNKDQKYRLLVQERYGRGGPRYQYVLSVRKPQPDFYPAAIHSQNPGPGHVTLWKGGTAYLDVITHFRDGLNTPMTITAEGLPPGVHAVPTTTDNQQVTFVFWSDEDAADFAGPIKLFATAKVGEQTLRREVRPYTRVWNQANISSSRPTREQLIAVRETAPYSLELVPNQIEIEAGKTAELKVQAKRLWPEFKNAINLIPLAFKGNFQMPNTTIAADTNDVTIRITVQAGTRPGEYTMSVLGQAQVPFNKAKDAKDRPNTLVSMASRPVTIKVTEPPKK